MEFLMKRFCQKNGSTYRLAHFLGNFREKTKKVSTRTLPRKLSEISRKFPKKFRALLPLAHFKKGNFLGNFEGHYYSHSFYSYQQA